MERCVLVVDDTPAILPMTHKAWAQQGYAQRCTKTGEEAADELLAAQHTGRDIRLIALVADHLNERLVPMVKLVRRVSSLPLLILTSEYHAKIRTEAFILGADRYLTIPQTIEEGIISGLALIRMSERYAGMGQDNGVLLLPNGFVINRMQRRVFLKNREIRLTRREFDLLLYLAVNGNITLSYEKIYEQVWRDVYDGAANQTIWATVKHLRDKLGTASEPFTFIKSERYIGYRFNI